MGDIVALKSNSPFPWRSAVSPEQARRAVQVATDVAHHLREPRNVAEAVSTACKQKALSRDIYWHPVSLAQGDAGIALSCGYLDACFKGEGWDITAHQYLQIAGEEAQRLRSTPGLFDGLAGLGFATLSLARGGTRYARLLRSIDEVLLSSAMTQAERVARHRHGMPVGEFDVISGLTGLGAYFLCRLDNPNNATGLASILRALVKLTGFSDRSPMWWTPAEHMGNDTMADQFPYGNLNCGMSHGIPGPLALMALSWSCGLRIPGLSEAVDRIAAWLIEHRTDDAWGPNWPIAVPLLPNGSPVVASACHPPARAAWCYGAPGVARALWLAGVALNRTEWRNLAVNAMSAVYRRPVAVRQIDSPTLCHGVAGLLQITLRFFNDTGLELFETASCALAEQLLQLYDPDSLLGFRNLEPGGIEVDQPSFLEGAAGVILALLAAATDVPPFWDRTFLLA